MLLKFESLFSIVRPLVQIFFIYAILRAFPSVSATLVALVLRVSCSGQAFHAPDLSFPIAISPWHTGLHSLIPELCSRDADCHFHFRRSPAAFSFVSFELNFT